VSVLSKARFCGVRARAANDVPASTRGTNTTTFTFPAAFSIQPAALSSEERLWIEQALEQGHSRPRMPDDPWLLHALRYPTLDVSLMNAQVRR
jgi:hypothetical protein